MNTNRRKFIKRSLLGTISACIPLSYQLNASPASRFNLSGTPIVAATWDNRKATHKAMETLLSGGTVLDAVEAGARIPEGDPKDTSVGYGGYPDRDGNVTLDACIMDEHGNAGSVTYLKHIKHPVSVARKVMEETPHIILSGDGALKFALDHGFQKEDLLTDHARKAWEEWKKENNNTPGNHDTIGILAIDSGGNISGACSTSGLAFKMPGRVGDSPIIGAGLYVDNEVGGACATGTGELVIKIVGSFLIVELMRSGKTPEEACKMAVERIVKQNPYVQEDDTQVGFVALNKSGMIGGYSIREGFSIAVSVSDKTDLLTPANYL